MGPRLLIKDKVLEINCNIYQHCKGFNKLNSDRALKIFTFLMNLAIMFTYFPGFLKYKKSMTILYDKQFNSHDQDEHTLELLWKRLERFSGFLLFLLLNFTPFQSLSRIQIDKTIDTVIEEGTQIDAIETFFCLNSLPPEMPLEFLEFIKSKTYVDYLPFPDLTFDSEFVEMKKNKAFSHLYKFYLFGFIPYLSNEHLALLAYLPKKELLKEFLGVFEQDTPRPFMHIDPALNIAFTLSNYTLVLGVPIFGSESFLDELFSFFLNYYGKRLPHMKEEISNTLVCYAQMLKCTQGKAFVEFAWNNIKAVVSEKTSPQFADMFLERVCYMKRYSQFPKRFELFEPEMLIDNYHTFLQCAGFFHFGKIITGTFWIWRSVLKYFQTLHREKVFRQMKGALLENKIYKDVAGTGFYPEKIILINRAKNPLESFYYRALKETIYQFPKKPIEIQAHFPEPLRSDFI